MKRLVRITLVIAISAVVGWWLWSHYGISEEARVRRVIAKMQQLIERGEGLKLSWGLNDCIAHDYSDPWGMNKGTLVQAILGYRSQYEEVTIYITDLKIQVNPVSTPGGEIAEATFAVRVVGRAKSNASDSVLPAEQYSEQYHLTLRKSDIGWQMTSAESARTEPRL